MRLDIQTVNSVFDPYLGEVLFEKVPLMFYLNLLDAKREVVAKVAHFFKTKMSTTILLSLLKYSCSFYCQNKDNYILILCSKASLEYLNFSLLKLGIPENKLSFQLLEKPIGSDGMPNL